MIRAKIVPASLQACTFVVGFQIVGLFQFFPIDDLRKFHLCGVELIYSSTYLGKRRRSCVFHVKNTEAKKCKSKKKIFFSTGNQSKVRSSSKANLVLVEAR
ncbi:unnamed protein product [Amoebophrya sp. A120]|nr:unnamed protein product [Amoebophrya sp. A120]|eukprot:GSA120T00009184001.1